MAFKQDNLTPIANNAKTHVVPALWMYWNQAGDTVTTAGFIPSNLGVSAGDQFIVVDADYEDNTFYHATVNSSTGVISLVANA